MIVKFAFCKSLRGATASFGETARPTAAHMLEGAGTRVASRQSVETKADRAVLGGLAERIGAGTGTLAMVGARTYEAVGLKPH